ncbi:hypothetical protein F5Y07DRAFT_321852 [Xylaria sp. FL0933]|nr:hypothetical protein F5Y07DRAFT_321852 [Xylaria sp. FL0933]
MASDFGQSWVNTSTTAFALDSWGCSTDAVLGTVQTSPGSKLQGGHGTESLTWSQTASAIASGLTDGYINWRTPAGVKFGVNIHVPLQIGPFGTAPYYQVWVNGGWEGKRTSEPFTFDKSLGYHVEVKPSAGHSNLHLTVTITDI